MAYTKIIPFLFIFFIGINSQPVKAQSLNIDADTIFINLEAEVQIIFPTVPTSYSTVPRSTQYRIWNVKTGINLIPGLADSTPATLLVSEGGRDHSFTLVFKQDISKDDTKLYYDYSTENKLAQHIRKKALAGLALAGAAPINIEPVKNGRKKRINEIEIKGTVDSSSNYYALLEQGEKEFRLQNYQDASASFNKAHVLRPQDIYPLQRIEAVKIQLAEKQQMGTINNLLTIKPQQGKGKKEKISKVNKADEALKEKQSADENNYNIAIKAADNFFKEGNYDTAKVYYNKALVFGKRDWPADQINKINKILNDRAAQAIEDKKLEQQLAVEAAMKPKIDILLTPAEIKKNYNLALANGKSSYNKNDLINAKIFYEEATRLQPLQPEPVNQLKIINNKLEEIARETEINNNYERAITLADSLVIAKAYGSAIIAYKEASAIKPLESYPKKEIKYIQSELALNEKRRREETERRYNETLAAADKAVADKRYEDAKSAYTEALGVHPDNEYAKRRLEIISYQLEKASLEKQSQDSVKEVVPVKKSKRKRFS